MIYHDILDEDIIFHVNNNNNNNNNIYSGSSTHRSVFQGGPVIYIYIIHGKLYYAYLKTIKYLQVDYI